ncbi:hypothetical protein [Caulobacter soli]|uniref:hypothetical protein n=1 Tax=Caulobacter soli TaxID=2708539 RepID=UPI0013EE088B|nr:hypothetical protein [Caulobacter soli]
MAVNPHLAGDMRRDLNQLKLLYDMGSIAPETFNDLIRLLVAGPAMLAALRAAEQFILNGTELGFIRMPDKGDPALDTLPAIQAAIARAEGRS